MPELSVIIPTYKERNNLIPLMRCLVEALKGIDYEVVIADDDSPDGTAAMARSLAQRDPRIRVVQRIGRKGLSSAVVEGMLATSSPYLAVMDADLQHDERILPKMLAKIRSENLDVVIGSRHAEEGGMGEFSAKRVALSNLGRMLSHKICRVNVSDPMSGFFMVTREHFHRVVHRLCLIGFKILVDILASSPKSVRVGEVGYTFGNRQHGESKLDLLVELEYLQLLLDKLTRGMIPVSFLLFALVGSLGVIFNFAASAMFIRVVGLPFKSAQLAGALMAIAFNFFLNNRITFRSVRLRGARIFQGLVLFYLCCLVGLFSQVVVADSLQKMGMDWALATFAGVVIGSVWNYSMAYLMVWQLRKRRTAGLQHAYAESDWLNADVPSDVRGLSFGQSA